MRVPELGECLVTTRITKIALLSTASAAAAAFALPGTAAAQSTTCTLASGSTTVYNCTNGTTGVSTLTVTTGTFAGTSPLTITSNSGAISATAEALNGGIIQNTTAGQAGVTLTNSFATGGISFVAPTQNIVAAGTGVSFTSTGGAVTVTTGDITVSGAGSDGISGTGATTAAIITGDIVTPDGDGADLTSSDDLTFTSGDVDAGGRGIVLTSTGGTVTADTGAITAAGDGATLTADSGIDFTAAGVTSTGGDGVMATTTTGPITLRTGAVSAVGMGISAMGTDGTVDIGSCPTVSTTGDAAPGVRAQTTTGDIIINCGAISTEGANSPGVLAQSGSGDVSVTTTSVDTVGFNSDGVAILTDGAVTTDVGNVTTEGDDSIGLFINAGAGDVEAGFGDITTSGTGAAYPVFISTGAGNVTLNGGNVVANGANQIGIFVDTGTGVVSGTTGDITAEGAGSQGLVISGAVNGLTVGNVSSASTGVSIDAGSEDILVTVGNVSTTEDNAAGVDLVSTVGSIDATIGNVTTAGLNSDGVMISTDGAITTDIGDITTEGNDSVGLLVTGGAGDVAAGYGNITTSGTGAAYPVLISTTSGDITLTGGNVVANGDGQIGIALDTVTGVISGTTGDITAEGVGGQGLVVTGAVDGLTVGNVTSASNGVVIDGGTEDILVTIGDVSTTEDFATGVDLLTTGTIDATIGDVTTTGEFADGVFASGDTGVTLDVGNVMTSGTESYGIVAVSAAGPADVTFGNVMTEGADSIGVVAATADGDITLNGGDITTMGDNSLALYGVSTTGNIDATFGAVTTEGADSAGVFLVTEGDVTVDGGEIDILGDNSTAAILVGGAVSGSLGNITATGLDSVGLIVASDGLAGDVDLTVGDVTTSGFGIDITNGDDAITLDAGDVSTTDADSPAISLTSNGLITLTAGQLSTEGDNSAALMVMGGAGGVTATIDGATTLGLASDGASIISAGPVDFTNTGTIDVSGDNSIGIDIATTTDAGSVTVDTGVVTSTAANVAADPSFAAVRVVAAGVAPVVVNATGDITTSEGSGIWAQTNGAATVNVASGVTVSGPVAVTLGGATQNTLLVNGTITSTTSGNPAYVVAGAGPLDLTIGATGTINGPLVFTAGNDVFTNNRTGGYVQSGEIDFGLGNDTFVNNTTFTQNALIDLGEGDDVITNNGVYNMAGTTDFGLGNDLFTNSATGTVNVTAAATLLGLETLTNAGTFNQNFALTFDDTANVVNNSGTFNAVGTTDFAGGADVFNNTGTLNVRGGATTFANLETFNNNGGIIDLRDNAANDTFTISGNYAATGNARLGLDVVGTATGNTADRLVIGGTTTGTTTVLANLVNPVIDPTGALIVDSTLNNIGGTNFVLGGVTTNGLINFALENRGGDVFFVSRPDEAVFDQLFVGRMANDIWYQSAEAYQAYAMSRRIDYGNERKGPVGIWAQLYGSKDRAGNRSREVTAFNTTLTTSNRLETDRRGAQVGLDFGAQNFIVGVTAGYEHAKADTTLGTDLDLEGYNYGAYAQFGAQQGLYAGLLIKRDTYEARIINNAVGDANVQPDGRSTGIDGEVGFRFGNPGGVNFDVGAGLSYVRSKIDDYTFGNIAFDNERFTSTRGRLQARASFAGKLAPFVDGKLFHEFGDNNETTIRSGAFSETIADGKRGTWARLEAGIGGGAGGGPLLSGWMDLGDVKGWGVRGGFRF